MILYNKYSQEELKERLRKENFKRTTISFYRYVSIDHPEELRDQLFIDWSSLNILGRIYLSKEGINAQMSVPEHNWTTFIKKLNSYKEFENIPITIAIEDDGRSFYKLKIKIRDVIVADGQDDNAFDVTNVGKHLSAEEFNNAMDAPHTIVVDMRNHYESEVGHFKGAICPDADTFKQELPMVLNLLKGKEDNKILLYCTGGIRCEKASAYLKHHGFKDVNQLQGGIVSYAHQVKIAGLESKFTGSNFVFDERLGERITETMISKCHQCANPCATHTNCRNDDCHLLFIQCEECTEKYEGCCTPECRRIANLSIEEQRELRKGGKKQDRPSIYKSRLRPKLKSPKPQI